MQAQLRAIPVGANQELVRLHMMESLLPSCSSLQVVSWHLPVLGLLTSSWHARLLPPEQTNRQPCGKHIYFSFFTLPEDT
jgi:hypothetical protein